MDVTLLGVRGALPAAGAEFARYGGNTPCVAVAHDEAPPTLVLDAGSGLRHLGRLLAGEPFRGTIVLGHLHWDHVCGLPFCPSIDRPDAEVRLLIPRQGDGEATDLLRRMFSPPFFPIGPEGLRGSWSIEWYDAGARPLEGFEVLSLDLPHPGGRCLGQRVTDSDATMTYATDHGPQAYGPGALGFGPVHPSILELSRSTDLLLHDAPYTAEEFPARAGFGHAAQPYAVDIAVAASARQLLLYGHDATRTDDDLDRIMHALADAPIPVAAAVEGTTWRLPAGTVGPIGGVAR